MNEIPQNSDGVSPQSGVSVGSPEPPKKGGKWKFWILSGLGLAFLAVLIFNPFSQILISVLVGSHQIKITEGKLQKPEIYQPVAQRLATYCQSDQNLFPKILSHAWLPGEISSLGEPWCEVATNYASVEFGGGFYHFGYRLELNKAASDPATNAWNLFLAREEQPDVLLMTMRLTSTQQVTAGDLAKLVGASYEQMIKVGEPGGYVGKVMLQLRFGQTRQVAAICEDWMKARPDSWLAQLTYAHIRCRMGQTEPAAAQFSEWVDAHQSFGNYIYLALFNYREGRTNQAAQAVRMALTHPLVESPQEGANIFYLADNGAMIAYASGDFDLCLSICDKMLPDNSYEAKVFRRNALRIKAAVMLMKGDQPAAIDLMKQAENANEHDSFGPDEKAKADNRLLEAIQQKNIEYIRDFRNWADEMEKWYSPFETDESGWHGGDLNIPTPFPASWRSDLMNTNFQE
jgi:tetratricopeptide (TPR) repeat protein